MQCIFVPDIFALAGKESTENANLTSAELLQFSASLVFYFMDPATACQAVADGQWVAKIRAFRARFSEETLTRDALQERAAELMGTIQRNLEGTGDQEVRRKSGSSWPMDDTT